MGYLGFNALKPENEVIVMFKQFVIGMAAAGSLGLATVASADVDNSSLTDSNDSGFYVKGQVGAARFNGGDKVLNFQADPLGENLHPIISTIKSNQASGRAAIGYNFNQYLAIESGFNYLGSFYQGFKGNQTFFPSKVYYGGTVSERMYALDLIGKVTIPFNKFFAFVDGGAASVTTSYKDGVLHTSTYITDDSKAIPNSFKLSSFTKNHISPVAGAGLGYNLSENVAVDVSYNRIFGIQSKYLSGTTDNSSTPNNFNSLVNVNQVLVGLTYKF